MQRCFARKNLLQVAVRKTEILSFCLSLLVSRCPPRARAGWQPAASAQPESSPSARRPRRRTNGTAGSRGAALGAAAARAAPASPARARCRGRSGHGHGAARHGAGGETEAGGAGAHPGGWWVPSPGHGTALLGPAREHRSFHGNFWILLLFGFSSALFCAPAARSGAKQLRIPLFLVLSSPPSTPPTVTAPQKCLQDPLL